MSELVDVGAAADFPERQVSIVEAERREIGILRWNGRFFALRNICPHLGARLCEGAVAPLLREQPGRPWTLDVSEERMMIVCPWHRWEFDASTGQALVGRLRVKTYPVTVRDGRLLVNVQRQSRATQRSG